MMRRLLLLALVLLVVGGVGMYFFGAHMIERFVLSRVLALSETYLNPKITIGGLTYEFPLTIHVTDLAMTEDDVAVLEVPSGSITLDTIPYNDGQVRFAGFTLNDPVIRFQVNKSDQLVGWGDIVRDSAEVEDSGAPPVRNSEAFAVRKVSITNGIIEYNDIDDPDRTMRLDEITLDLDTDTYREKRPSARELPEGAPSIPVGGNWYQIEASLDRSPIVSVDLDCGLDIDTGNIVVRLLGVDTRIDPDAVAVLPPQVQDFVQTHRLAGSYSSSLWGSVIVDDPLEGPLNMQSKLIDANFTDESGTLEISRLESRWTLKQGVLSLSSLKGELLGGTIEGDGEILLEEEPPRPRRRTRTESDPTAQGDGDADMIPGRPIYSMIAGVQLDEIDLSRLTGSRRSSSRLRGRLDLDLEMNGIADQLPETLVGDGFVSIDKGRLANIPVISVLGRVANVILLRDADNDRLNADLTLRSDGVLMEGIRVTAGLMAVRGRGIIRFNDSLLFVLNAGPMERLQDSIGAIGRAMGAVTDRLVRYEVTGPIGEPSVRVRPFGINVGDPTAPPPPRPPAGDDRGPDADEG